MAKGKHIKKSSPEEKRNKILFVTDVLNLAKAIYDIFKDILS